MTIRERRGVIRPLDGCLRKLHGRGGNIQNVELLRQRLHDCPDVVQVSSQETLP